MGKIGEALGRIAGRALGKYAGDRLGKYTGVHGAEGANFGSRVGGSLGSLLPFKKGGRVRKTGAILAHKGEFILPKGIKPTKSQLKRVKKRGGRV